MGFESFASSSQDKKKNRWERATRPKKEYWCQPSALLGPPEHMPAVLFSFFPERGSDTGRE
jgi:hypothetical protein